MQIHRSAERGSTQLSWLNSKHSFSFGDFVDRSKMNFRSLRVLNDDIVAPGMGFDTHPHKNMEILTYVVSGELRHKDSAGNESILKAGAFQLMSAGAGVYHSEFNASDEHPVRFIQIWIEPRQLNLPSSYQEGIIEKAGEQSGSFLIASPQAEDRAALVGQDAKVSFLWGVADGELYLQSNPQRYYWLQLVTGTLSVSGQRLSEGDALSFEPAEELREKLQVQGIDDFEALLFELS